MYTSFFGLNEKPFSITPDPRYLYMSERHSEALAHLLYGITESGGFIQLTGEVGTGKTTLIRSLLQQLPEATDVALILNPQLSCIEFLVTIVEELRLGRPSRSANAKSLITVLNHYLLENHSKGRRTVLIVDEAQNLTVEVLEQIRLLTNLETARQKLLRITLIGQPELRKLLERKDMRGFRYEDLQEQVDAFPLREAVVDWEGPIAIEAYTVAYRAGNPRIGYGACLTDDGRRTWGTVEDPAILDAMTREEFCGRRGRLDGNGRLSVD